jgi:phosphoribosylamine---glycine ligase
MMGEHDMKVLVVGAGGREHALAWKISQSDKVEKVYCTPGNAGISHDAECLTVQADDLEGIVSIAEQKKVGLVMVGPEVPLTMGITDMLEEKGIPVFGCSRKAAELEGSKAFSKELMKKYNIPTSEFGVFDDPEKAKQFAKDFQGKLVVKADGLAAGKGVIVCDNLDEAVLAIENIMEKREFGEAGDKIVLEERLFGEEASFLAFTDGETVLPMASSQDHKAIFDGDKGPNTGGMGAYTPAPVVSAKLHDEIMETIMIPTVKAMHDMGRPYKGVLYAGVMVTEKGPMVLEFNARFGDPETQPLMFRMKSDIVDFLMACAIPDGSLKDMEMKWKDPTVTVVMAADGYPGSYKKGFEISGIDNANKLDETYVFHAGTAMKDGKLVTSGGRVLGVTSCGKDIEAAINNAYKAVDKISWEGAYCRKDIGQKALK